MLPDHILTGMWKIPQKRKILSFDIEKEEFCKFCRFWGLGALFKRQLGKLRSQRKSAILIITVLVPLYHTDFLGATRVTSEACWGCLIEEGRSCGSAEGSSRILGPARTCRCWFAVTPSIRRGRSSFPLTKYLWWSRQGNFFLGNASGVPQW